MVLPSGGKLVRNFEFGELLHDALCFLRIEIGIQRLVLDLDS